MAAYRLAYRTCIERTAMAFSACSRPPLFTRVVPLLSLFPLLVFAAEGAFSFQRGVQNTSLGMASEGFVSALNEGQLQVIRLQTYAVYLLCTVLMLPLLPKIWRTLRHNPLVLLMIALCASSIGWSNNPLVSLSASLYIAIETAFAVYLVERLTTDELMILFTGVGAVAAVASLLAVVILPQYAVHVTPSGAAAWQGIFGQKNLCGATVSILLLPAFFIEAVGWMAKAGRAIYAGVVLLIIYESHSAGALLVTIGCLAFVAILYVFSRFDGRGRFAIAGAASVTVTILGILVMQNISTILLALGKDSTLTGRTAIWAQILTFIMKRPILGYGLNAFWQGLHGESGTLAIALHWSGITYAESGLLELWLQLGLLGVLLYLALFAAAVRDAVFCLSRETSRSVMWYTTILFYVVLSNIEGGKLVCPGAIIYILPVVSFIGLRKEARRLREGQQHQIATSRYTTRLKENFNAA